MTASQKLGVRLKSQLHCLSVLLLCQNQASIHKEQLKCGTFPYRCGLSTINMFKKTNVRSRGSLGTGFTYASVRQRAVNRRPGSRSDNSWSRDAFIYALQARTPQAIAYTLEATRKG